MKLELKIVSTDHNDAGWFNIYDHNNHQISIGYRKVCHTCGKFMTITGYHIDGKHVDLDPATFSFY